MGDYTAVRIDDIETIYGGTFRRARAALGATAFGMQVLELAPNLKAYPAHDHSSDGQEEVYVVLRGEGEMEIEGERVRLDPETLVRVAPGTRRKVLPGESGLRLLVVGGVPGEAFHPKQITELGQPDPLTRA